MTEATNRDQEWDAPAYHRVAQPQLAWGLKVLARLHLEGHETVLDAGCGSGRLTAELLARLPQGKVIAVDQSENMIAEASKTLAVFGDHVQLIRADLTVLELPEQVDFVFSGATFHWVLDHARLFQSLFKVLRPGGRMVAQCGGGRNLYRLHQRALVLSADVRFAEYFADWQDPWYFADEASTQERLTEAGFVNVVTSVEAMPTPFPDRAAFIEFLRTVVLRHHLAMLPNEDLRTQFLDAIAEEAAADVPPFTLDYWRLNIDATRPVPVND